MVVYKIANKENGKAYIGSTGNPEKRWVAHRSELRRGIHPNQILQRAWQKYGEDSFEFIILERLEGSEEMVEREQALIDALRPEYNIRKTASSNLGLSFGPQSEEHKNKIRTAIKGIKRSEETKEKLRNRTFIKGKEHPRYGVAFTEEHKKNISKAAKARKGTPWNKGKKTGAIPWNKGKKVGGGHWKGKTLPEEMKRKISETKKSRNYGGERASNAKLKEGDVIEIRRLLREGSLTQGEIGKMFGVRSGHISKIKTGLVWFCLKEE